MSNTKKVSVVGLITAVLAAVNLILSFIGGISIWSLLMCLLWVAVAVLMFMNKRGIFVAAVFGSMALITIIYISKDASLLSEVQSSEYSDVIILSIIHNVISFIIFAVTVFSAYKRIDNYPKIKKLWFIPALIYLALNVYYFMWCGGFNLIKYNINLLLVPIMYALICFWLAGFEKRTKVEKEMADYKYSLMGANGQLYVYKEKIVIARKGFVGFLSQGMAGNKTIPMASIHSVQFKEGGAMVNGFIQFGVTGGVESSGGVLAATRDENTIMVKQADNNLAYEIKEYIEGLIIARSKPVASVIQQVQQVSAADELKKFKELLDSGIISQEEFDAKKKDLLGI